MESEKSEIILTVTAEEAELFPEETPQNPLPVAGFADKQTLAKPPTDDDMCCGVILSDTPMTVSEIAFSPLSTGDCEAQDESPPSRGKPCEKPVQNSRMEKVWPAT